jgi:hypothetical protein
LALIDFVAAAFASVPDRQQRRYATAFHAKIRFGSKSTELRWSRDVRFSLRKRAFPALYEYTP